jgi:hypothetical protein
MGTLTRDEFCTLLLRAVERTRALAQADLAEPLPQDTLLVLVAFDQGHRTSSVDEVLAHLYRGGAFPRVVVVGLRGLIDGKALVSLGPSGHSYVRDRALTWNFPPEMGPFNCVGLMLGDSVWQRPRPFTRQDLEDSAAPWARQRTS